MGWLRYKASSILRRVLAVVLIVGTMLCGVLVWRGKIGYTMCFETIDKCIGNVNTVKCIDMTHTTITGAEMASHTINYTFKNNTVQLIIKENDKEITRYILDIDNGKLFMRIDSLPNREVDGEGRVWNGERYVECKDYMVLNLRSEYVKLKESNEYQGSRLEEVVLKVPFISMAVFGVDGDASVKVVSPADLLIRSSAEIVTGIIREAVPVKNVSSNKPGFLNAEWTVKADNAKEVSELLYSVDTVLSGEADARLRGALLNMGDALDGMNIETKENVNIQWIKDWVMGQLQCTSGSMDEFVKRVTEGYEDVTFTLKTRYDAESGYINFALKQFYRDEEGRLKYNLDATEINSREEYKADIFIPKDVKCVPYNEVECIEAVREYLNLEKVIETMR